MNVLIVSEYPLPPDPRIEKQARALSEAGHAVLVLCPRSEGEPLREETSWGMIERVEVEIRRSWDWTWSYLDHAYRSPDSPWVEVIEKTLRRHRAGMLQVADCPLAVPGAYAARRAGVPLIVDFHEYWPELVMNLCERYGSGQGEVWRAPLKLVDWWFDLEAMAVREAQKIILVSEAAMKRFSGRYREDGKFQLVRNGLDLQEFGGGQGTETADPEGRFDLGYIGSMDRTRNFRGLLRGVRALIDTGRPVRLFLGGAGPMRPSIEEEVRSLGLGANVRLAGFVPRESFAAVMRRIHIGLILWFPSAYARMAAPWKLSEYLFFCPWVISSVDGEIQDVLVQARGGEIVSLDAPDDFARSVRRLLDCRPSAEEWTERRAFVKSHLSWEAQKKSFLSCFSGS